MKYGKLILLAALFSIYSRAGSKCRGGDGPVPMFDLTYHLPTVWTELKIKGPINEFLVWENKDLLVYRNYLNEVRKQDLIAKTDSHFFYLDRALVRNSDPRERFLVTRSEASVVDTEVNPMSVAYLRMSKPFADLVFWAQDFVFGLMGKRGDLSFFSYRLGTYEDYSCSIPIYQQGIQLAEGAKFPYAFLYDQYRTRNGYQLVFYPIRLSTGSMKGDCRMLSPMVYPEIFKSRVQKVHLLSGGGFLAKLEEREHPLLYESGSSCTYYDFEGVTPILLNSAKPYVAGKGEKGELWIYDLFSGNKRHLLTKDRLEIADSRNFWLTRGGNQLFVVLKDSKKEHEKLLRFELNELR